MNKIIVESDINEEVGSINRITISELPRILPDFKNSTDTKNNIIKKWLLTWIIQGLKSGKIKEKQLIPSKKDLALYLGVSIGTIQNAIRYIEDVGYLESKQKIGTMLKNRYSNTTPIRKLTSKREQLIFQLKKYILDSQFRINQPLPSIRILSKITGASINTTRLAIECLAQEGIITACKGTFSGNNENYWIIKKFPEFDSAMLAKIHKKDFDIESKTLVSKIKIDILNYINLKYNIGEKIPPHSYFSKILKVSIKTVHDAINLLIKDDILIAKRGKYGTFIKNLPDKKSTHSLKNNFVDNEFKYSFYSYEKIKIRLINYIKELFDLGDKLPSIEELSLKFNVSTNTIHRALSDLNKDGIVQFSRGRYGGTFVTDLPDENYNNIITSSEITASSDVNYKWLAINPEYIKRSTN